MISDSFNIDCMEYMAGLPDRAFNLALCDPPYFSGPEKRGYYGNAVSPIVDWSEETVWRFISDQELPYCSLYNEGFHRLGCIGCPMASKKEKLRSFERWPKYRDQYIRTFDKMIVARKEAGLPTEWKTGEEVMQWWING